MARAVHSFWLDLTLHHPSYDPGTITQTLGLQPWHSAKVGQTLGTITRNSTVWMLHFREGVKDEEFAQALEDFTAFLEKNRDFLKILITEGGEALLTINKSIAFDDGILLRLQLQPFF
ncbi:MAG TPA: hypothetical protein VI386_13340, partial [Candidatus Sulfotelmatobacter sp.]